MQRINRPDLNVVGERFDTFDEMYKVCEGRDLRPYYRNDRCAKDDRDVHDEKNVTYSWEQTKHDIMFGSDLFNEDFEEVRREVEKDVESYMHDFRRAVAKKDIIGQSVCVERAMLGHPKAFNHRIPDRRKQKTVHFLYNITCAWYTSTRERLKSGCILMAVAEAMEKMGYQTAITYTPFFSYERDSEPSMIAEVQIKDYKTRFNPKKIQFPLAAESILFQLGCWWMHRCPEGTYDYGGGEGMCVDYDSDRKRQAKQYAKDMKAIYLSTPMMVKEFHLDVNQVFDYVFEQLKEM